MTNREEREEVAKKLREGGIARNVSEAYVLLLHCIGIRPQLPAVYTYKPALERLADLIDPTCRIYWTDTSFNTPDTGYVADGYYSCSNCDGELGDILAEMWDSFQANGYEGEPPFDCCPYCGARVVRDEA